MPVTKELPWSSSKSPRSFPRIPQANITDLLVERVKKTPQLALFAVPEGDGWRDVTAAEFQRQVIALAKGFVAAGHRAGRQSRLPRAHHVRLDARRLRAVLSPARSWSRSTRRAPPPRSPGTSPTPARSPASSSRRSTVARLDEIRAEVPLVRSRWSMHSGDLDKLIDQGKDVPDAEIERRRNIANGADIATLIYTSGSTGRPKGCVLTHSNFVELTRNSAKALSEVVETPGASTLLFITTAHIFARFISILAIHAGVKTGHQPDTRQLLPALGLVQAVVPARRAARVREGVQLRRAEGRGRRQGQDLPRRRAHRRRALEAAAGGQEDPALHEDQVRAVRSARLQQAARGDGRPRRVRRVGLRAARPAARSLLPQPRPHRSSRATA